MMAKEYLQGVFRKTFVRRCALPGCNKDCYVEDLYQHDYCGRSHAKQHAEIRRQEYYRTHQYQSYQYTSSPPTTRPIRFYRRDVPDYRTQKAEVHPLLQQRPKKGELWYLVDLSWMKQWRKYIGDDPSDQSQAGESSAHPGPLYNDNLLASNWSNPDNTLTIDDLTELSTWLRSLASNWFKFGKQLGVSTQLLDTIPRLSGSQDPYEHLKLLLAIWLTQQTATVEVLQHSLSDNGLFVSYFLQGKTVLKEQLMEELDYFLLPEAAWDKLVAWYGLREGSRVIPRMVHEYGLFMKHLKVEVYPLELELCLHPNLTKSVPMRFSRSHKVGFTEHLMKNVFNISEDAECRVWHRYMTHTYELLSRPEQTLQDAGLYNGQMIVIEQRNRDETWPRSSTKANTDHQHLQETHIAIMKRKKGHYVAMAECALREISQPQAEQMESGASLEIQKLPAMARRGLSEATTAVKISHVSQPQAQRQSGASIEIQKLQQDAESLRKENEALQPSVDEKEQAFRHLEENAQQTQQTLAQYQRTIASLEQSKQQKQQNIHTLENQVAEKDQNLEELHRRSENLEGANCQQQQTIHSLETTLHTSEQALQQSEQRNQASEQRIQTQQQTIHSLETTLHTSEQALQQSEQRIQASVQRIETQQQTICSLETRIQDAEQSLQQSEQRNQASEQRIQTQQQTIATLEQDLHESCQLSDDFERRLRETEGRIAVSDHVFQDILQRLTGQIPQSQPFWVVQRDEIELTAEELGTGGWATVRVANFRGQRVAAKCLHNQIISAHNVRLFTREMGIAAQARHPNLLQFIGATMDNGPIILTELLPTSLRRILEQGVQLTRAKIVSISSDVARALNYLHLSTPDAIVHRDISSANVLLDPIPGDSWRAKVSDYGSANFVRYTSTVGPGSPIYSAPEANDPQRHSPKMDVYSFGILLVEVCSGELPENPEELIQQIRWPEMVQLIRLCMRIEPQRRPDMGDVITELGRLAI